MTSSARSPNYSTLRVSLRHHIWRVTLDGSFYGDYRAEMEAMESAEAAAEALRGCGRLVTIVGTLA